MGNMKHVLGCTNRAEDLVRNIRMMRHDNYMILVMYFDKDMTFLFQQKIRIKLDCLVYNGQTFETGKPPVELPENFLRKPVWEVIAYTTQALPKGAMAHVTPLGEPIEEVGVIDPHKLPKPNWA